MDQKYIICLGLGLLIGSSVVFVASWIIVGRLKHGVRPGVELMWFRCLAVCFYVGLAVLFVSAVGSVILATMKGIL
jgi:hypothetical protein